MEDLKDYRGVPLTMFVTVLNFPWSVHLFLLVGFLTAQMVYDVRGLSERAQQLYKSVNEFMIEYIYPVERELTEHSLSKDRWTVHPLIEELKVSLEGEEKCVFEMQNKREIFCFILRGIFNVVQVRYDCLT